MYADWPERRRRRSRMHSRSLPSGSSWVSAGAVDVCFRARGADSPTGVSAAAIVSSRALSLNNRAERPDVVEEWSPDERLQFELAQKDPAAAADLAIDEFAPAIQPLEEYPKAIHEVLEAAEGDRWFFEDASRTEIFDAHLRETWRQGLDAIKWEMIDTFQDWGFRLAESRFR